MEKSIKRVERLVHATNSTLAQMKFSLMFDEAITEKKSGKFWNVESTEPGFGDVDQKNLKLREAEFRSEANEILSKMEEIFGPNELNRKNFKVLDRIREINEKISDSMQEPSKGARETEQSRGELLRLISEKKYSPGISFESESVKGDKELAIRKAESCLNVAASPIKSKEELKKKILETQEIVDRGFQTARKLAQKVESMSKPEKKEKRATLEKPVAETDLKKLKTKSRSSETLTNYKCPRHLKDKENKLKTAECGTPTNALVLDIKGKELPKTPKWNLQIQHLPSLEIRGELQLQKVHNVEIPAGESIGDEKPNVAFDVLSHEDIEREKVDNILKQMKKGNRFGTEERNSRGNYVECFNCGKLIEVREFRVDPQKVDEILKKCNYNVFDPRIDEFVEKYGSADESKRREKSPPSPTSFISLPRSQVKRKENKNSSECVKKGKIITLDDLSNDLFKKYKEEAENLENSHLKLDKLLMDLLAKIEESREVFEECHLLRNEKSKPRKMQTLTSTKPILVSLMKASSKIRTNQTKLEKKDVKNRSRSRSKKEKENSVTSSSPSSLETKEILQKKKRISGEIISQNKKRNVQDKRMKNFEGETSKSIENDKEKRKTNKISRDDEAVPSVSRKRTKQPLEWPTKAILSSFNEERSVGKEEKQTPSSTSTSSSDARKESSEKHKMEASASAEGDEHLKGMFTTTLSKKGPSDDVGGKGLSETEKSETYESDFESASIPNEPEDKGDGSNDRKPEGNAFFNKLSVISEVDSALEKKVGDEQKTSISETLRDESNDSRRQRIARNDAEPNTSGSGTPAICLNSFSAESVASLKDILSTLKHQFSKTETLAEKLTKEKVEEGDVPCGPRKMLADAEMMETLRSSRKTPGAGRTNPAPSESQSPLRNRKKQSLTKSGESSASEKSFINSAAAKSGVDGDGGSRSEGEISSGLLAEFEGCRSLGELSH